MMPEQIPGDYDRWKLDNGPYENDGDPECFKCKHFRRPAPNYEGWCLHGDVPTGDIDRCQAFEPDGGSNLDFLAHTARLDPVESIGLIKERQEEPSDDRA